MATKLKNFLCNPIIKFINVLLLLLASAGILFVIIQLLSNNYALNDRRFYETHDFSRNFDSLSQDALEKELVLLSEADILASGEVQGVINDAISRLRSIEGNLKGATSFKYVLVNKYDNELLTNMPDEDPLSAIKSYPISVYYEYGDKYYPDVSQLSNDRYYAYDSRSILEILNTVNQNSEEDWVYYTAVDVSIDSSDTFFYEDSMRFETFSSNRDQLLFILVAGIALGTVTLLLFFFTTGIQGDGKPMATLFYDAVPLEIQAIITILFSSPLVAYASTRTQVNTHEEIMIFVGLSAFIIIGILLFLASLIRRVKSKQFFSTLLIVRWLRWIGKGIKSLFSFIKPPALDEGYKWKILMWMAIWLAANLLSLFIMVGAWPLGIVLMLVINIYCIRWVMKLANDLVILKDNVHSKTLNSDVDALQPELFQPVLREFGKDIESLQDGLELAVDERLKGEKMKTELITNVTHDLKNPLTSIISYVELLKGKDVMDEEADKYIGVLDDKSQRLKTLIDQLVDAAKASSGTISVTMVPLDLVQMIRQLCGEYEETLEARHLQCILPELDHKIMINADPMILHRILDNVMSNVCKYAMEGTRVYLELDQRDGQIIMTVKNISSEPLTKNVEDLSRRFVRGDSSRNTEGSGLGISIALSLAKLIKAKMTFRTDGDLFKVRMLFEQGD